MAREKFPSVLHGVDRLLHGDAGFDLAAVVDVLSHWVEEEAPEGVRQALIEHLEAVYAEHTEEE
jgi:hypothetical protein